MEVYIDGEVIGDAYELQWDKSDDLYEGVDENGLPHWSPSSEYPAMSFNAKLDPRAFRYLESKRQRIVISLSEEILRGIPCRQVLELNIDVDGDLHTYECTVTRRGFKAQKLFLEVNNIRR